MFEKTPEDYAYNDYYNHSNEPVHHIPYLFAYIGKPWLTQKYVRHIMENAYGLGPKGLCGNEDVGQMSAWYVMSAMGFHPVAPGDSVNGRRIWRRAGKTGPTINYAGREGIISIGAP